jgi:polysaccharide pyruvyl transferase WcaK-like protein
MRAALPPEYVLADPTPTDVAETLAHYNVVVSARFHALALAALVGVPFIGLGDPDKTGRLCRRLGMPFLPWSATDSDVAEVIEMLMNGRRPAATTSMTHLHSEALRTSELL